MIEVSGADRKSTSERWEKDKLLIGSPSNTYCRDFPESLRFWATIAFSGKTTQISLSEAVVCSS